MIFADKLHFLSITYLELSATYILFGKTTQRQSKNTGSTWTNQITSHPPHSVEAITAASLFSFLFHVARLEITLATPNRSINYHSIPLLDPILLGPNKAWTVQKDQRKNSTNNIRLGYSETSPVRHDTAVFKTDGLLRIEICRRFPL